MGDRQEGRGNGAVALRQVGVVAVLAQGRRLLHGVADMGQAEQGDLGAHQGAVGLVEIQQLQRLVVAGVFEVLADEAPRMALQSAILEVHGQEGEIGADVGEAERLVEFDAVEQHHLIVDDRGITQVDVAMAFADEAVGLARLEYRQQAIEGSFRPGFQGIQLLQVAGFRQQRTDLLEILPHRRHAGFGRAQRILLGNLRSALVEIGDLPGQGIDVRFAQFAACLHFAEQTFLGELAAFEHVLDGRTGTVQYWRILAAGDRQDFEVQAFSQALVEAQLFLAEVLAGFEAGEVEEAEVHRLLDLVDVGAGEKYPGNVGLDQPEVLYRMREEGRVLQGGDQRLAHGRSLLGKYESLALWRLGGPVQTLPGCGNQSSAGWSKLRRLQPPPALSAASQAWMLPAAASVPCG
ncbi:hypothetical protein D9M71_89480 [compost metagenome]